MAAHEAEVGQVTQKGASCRKKGWEAGSATQRVGTQTSGLEDPHHGSERVPSEPEGFVRSG